MLEYVKKNWVVLAVSFIVVMVLWRLLKQVADKGQAAPKGGIGVPKVAFKCNPDAQINREKELRKGLKGSNEVCYLQRWLNTYYGAGLAEDGNFGSKTEAALVKATNKAYGSLNYIGA